MDAGKIKKLIAAGSLIAGFAAITCSLGVFAGPEKNVEDDSLPGGDTTVFVTTNQAFARPAANLPTNKLRDFSFGNRLFNTNWVTAPSSVTKFDGLGPIFNRVSCSACHLLDGRGQPPAKSGDPMNSMLVRLSIPGQNEHGGPKHHPQYGDQLNDRAIQGVPAEGRAIIRYKEIFKKFSDGETYGLQEPAYQFEDLNFGPLGEDILISPRVAPAMAGLGLLEAVSEKTILGFADEKDREKDGISGKPNYVWDEVHKKTALGRFGWKANQPSLRQQDAGAAVGDIGITSPLFPHENIAKDQTQALKAPSGRSPELEQDFLDKLVFYSKTLAVPARRNRNEPMVRRGEELFREAKCVACHVPSMVTGAYPEVPELANQKIHPYTDLLLHDMGEGLADGRPDFQAAGNEWRTAPLWGIGLVKTVNGHTRFLHDGRARNLMEAILWHGGEAQESKKAVEAMNKKERAAIVAFLESL